MPELPAELPDSFFSDASKALPKSAGSWRPTSAMMWYDGIIDDILANPGTSIKETAARLGRAAGTLYIIVNSDLFRARYAQRRKEHSEALQEKLTAKLSGVASLALDSVKEKLEKSRDQVPLPQLVEIVTGTMDRLGYAPQRSGGGANVSVNVTSQAASVSEADRPASSGALSRARDFMKVLEAQKVDESRREAALGTSTSRQQGHESEEGREGPSSGPAGGGTE